MSKKSNAYKLAIVSILGIILVFYYLTQNIIPAITEKNDEIQTKKVTLTEERSRLARLGSLAKQEDLLKTYLSIVQRALPKEDEKTSIPLHLDSIANKHSVSLSRVTGGTTKSKGNLPDWINVEVHVSGIYQNCLDFIQSLQLSNRITDVDTLSITAAGKGKVEVILNVKAFFKE